MDLDNHVSINYWLQTNPTAKIISWPSMVSSRRRHDTTRLLPPPLNLFFSPGFLYKVELGGGVKILVFFAPPGEGRGGLGMLMPQVWRDSFLFLSFISSVDRFSVFACFIHLSLFFFSVFVRWFARFI